MFTCYPKYNINLRDKDFDNSLSLYFKFLRNDFMKQGNNVMTMCYIFQRIREDVHSPFLIKENYYNREREVEETRILIDTGASCNHIQADKCEMIGNKTNPNVFKNYNGQTLKCNLKIEISIR